MASLQILTPSPLAENVAAGACADGVARTGQAHKARPKCDVSVRTFAPAHCSTIIHRATAATPTRTSQGRRAEMGDVVIVVILEEWFHTTGEAEASVEIRCDSPDIFCAKRAIARVSYAAFPRMYATFHKRSCWRTSEQCDTPCPRLQAWSNRRCGAVIALPSYCGIHSDGHARRPSSRNPETRSRHTTNLEIRTPSLHIMLPTLLRQRRKSRGAWTGVLANFCLVADHHATTRRHARRSRADLAFPL